MATAFSVATSTFPQDAQGAVDPVAPRREAEAQTSGLLHRAQSSSAEYSLPTNPDLAQCASPASQTQQKRPLLLDGILLELDPEKAELIGQA